MARPSSAGTGGSGRPASGQAQTAPRHTHNSSPDQQALLSQRCLRCGMERYNYLLLVGERCGEAVDWQHWLSQARSAARMPQKPSRTTDSKLDLAAASLHSHILQNLEHADRKRSCIARSDCPRTRVVDKIYTNDHRWYAGCYVGDGWSWNGLVAMQRGRGVVCCASPRNRTRCA